MLDGAASITIHGKTHPTVLLQTAAFRVSATIGVGGFTRLRSYRGQRQIVAMERKELSTLSVKSNKTTLQFFFKADEILLLLLQL